MKKILVSVLAVSTIAAAVPAAAQGYGNGWQNINQRQANLDRRIDQGIRNGQLTRGEAVRLRAEFRDIARLEARYRRGGLSNWERSDLDRRFDALSARVRWERRDNQDYGRNDRDNRDYRGYRY
jgi:Ni/Co efflux regulator RcnB